MDKLENYYKNKFEDFEMEALPDAFDKIQQSLDSGVSDFNSANENFTKTTWMKSTSAWMKISTSMNVILLIALPIAYYWGSSRITTPTQYETVKQNKESIVSTSTPTTDIKKTNNPNSTASTINSKNSTNKTTFTGQKIETKDIQTDNNTPTQAIDPAVKNSTLTQEHNQDNKMVEAPKTLEQKKETSTNTQAKRKKNIEAYYEDNATKLKDSTSQLFKKK